MKITTTLQKIIQFSNLTKKEAYTLVLTMMKEEISQVQTASLLTALSMKGETTAEISGFIQAMRQHMISLSVPHAIDVCGTGGDGKNAFNISTAVAFVVSGAGVRVAKHGNRAASSRSGSADVLQELGVKIDIMPDQVLNVLNKVGMAFLFAPLFHRSMKYVSHVRKEMQIKTIFNYLGPFTNPAKVKRQLVGVSNNATAARLAEVIKDLDYEHIIITCTEDGFDEVSLSVPTQLFEVKNNILTKNVITPEQFGFHRTNIESIQGGTPRENAKIIVDLLNGEKGPRRDIVILNSGVGLYISGKVKTIDEGIQMAIQAIDTGKAAKILQLLREETQKYA